MKKKKVILYSLIVVGVILIIVGAVLLFKTDTSSKNNNDNGEKHDEQPVNPPVDDDEGEIYFSPDKKEDKDIETVNFKYSKDGDAYLLSIDVYNKSKVNYSNLIIYLKLYDEDGNYVDAVEMHLGKIKSGENKTSNIKTYNVLPPIADYEMKVSKNSR